MTTPAQPAVWRVYLPEWVAVYTSHATGEEGRIECESHYREHYHGKVRDSDWRTVSASPDSPDGWQYLLQVRLPNRKGEWSDPRDAERQADGLGPLAQVAARFSDKERQITSYGTRRLRDD
jgi:hypothetical protein